MASVQTHTAKHSLRAGANKKAGQRAQRAQERDGQGSAQAGPSSKAAAATQGTDKKGESGRKTVFKQVLGSPLTVNW